MSKPKIFNDPVYGFITIPKGLVFDLIEHPYYQRLRRVKQLGLTHYVYPGALHTRFHHALGAVHLMSLAIDTLRSKGVGISEEEAEAVCVAILLHDIGHGPFSHALEHKIINVHHELLTEAIMDELNEEFGGKLSLAIEIFKGNYPKVFLHQLISGQLDMDRLDYLNRDSFFTGVAEGVVGYDRIIKMLNVVDNQLVVEEKGIYSVEKFLIARRLMYWQCYLHKTALAAEQMLASVVMRAREISRKGIKLPVSKALHYFLVSYPDEVDLKKNRKEVIKYFSALDDFDIISALKEFVYEEDLILSSLSNGIINRQLFKVKHQNSPFESDEVEKFRNKAVDIFNCSKEEAKYLVLHVEESNAAYNQDKEEIMILFKSGEVKPVSEWIEQGVVSRKIYRYYLCVDKKLL